MSSRKAAEIAQSRFVAAPDGLKLHVRCYRTASSSLRLPLLCLPGLTRNESDFEPLARYLTAKHEYARPVFVLDSRGRGRSAYDSDWRNYNPAVELADVIAVTTALRLDRAVFLGTSRGGILTMLLAAVQPALIAGAILNDIGPVIEQDGLMRIKSYVGRIPTPDDRTQGAAILRGLFGAQFPKLNEADWHAWANRSWQQGRHGLIARYDQKLAETLNEVAPDQPLPNLWEQFGALPKVPIMVVRGALSDILSPDTLRAMRERRPDLEAVEVPDQGHAPLLAEPAIMRRIADFLRRCDRAAGSQD